MAINVSLVNFTDQGIRNIKDSPQRARAFRELCKQQGVQRFQPVDGLCNIAGSFRMGDAVHETTDKDWDIMMDVNVRTVLITARAVVPVMLQAGAGKVVNIGAFAAQKGSAQMGAYIA